MSFPPSANTLSHQQNRVLNDYLWLFEKNLDIQSILPKLMDLGIVPGNIFNGPNRNENVQMLLNHIVSPSDFKHFREALQNSTEANGELAAMLSSVLDGDSSPLKRARR
jgi:hypothetical protein